MFSIYLKVLIAFNVTVMLIAMVSVPLFNKFNPWIGIGSGLLFIVIGLVFIYKQLSK